MTIRTGLLAELLKIFPADAIVRVDADGLVLMNADGTGMVMLLSRHELTSSECLALPVYREARALTS
jgi:hypothetical protein